MIGIKRVEGPISQHHQNYLDASRAASLAIREATQAGVNNDVALIFVGMRAGWSMLEAAGCNMSPAVAEQIAAYHDPAIAPLAHLDQ